MAVHRETHLVLTNPTAIAAAWGLAPEGSSRDGNRVVLFFESNKVKFLLFDCVPIGDA